MAEQVVGTVTHYFPKPEVGVVKASDEIKVGDTLHFVGHTTDFEQKIDSMEIDHAAVETATAGDEVAIKVAQRVRDGDRVFRVGPE